MGMRVNIRERESCANMVAESLERFGRIDGLVNNGGGQFHSKGIFHFILYFTTSTKVRG